MEQRLKLCAAFVFLATVCSSPPVTFPKATAPVLTSPSAPPDIKRANLDIAYSAFVDQDVHNVSSKEALESGLEAVREEVRAIGGDDMVPTPAFKDVNEVVLADFRLFAEAVETLAAKNPRLSADRISTAAIRGMIRASPDCHTYYVAGGRTHESRSQSESGVANPSPPDGVVLQEPDEAELQARLLGDGVAWIRFSEFRITGTYDIRAEVKKLLTKALAAGAKAWLFDLRGNTGGNGANVIASYFLNGEPTMTVTFRNGSGGTTRATTELRLPPDYQLPIAVILGRGGSGPEVFALYLKETSRATLVGQRTIGCLGATSGTPMRDGSTIYVTVQEYIGASGTKYNNIGIEPDLPAADAEVIEVASRHLRDKIAGR